MPLHSSGLFSGWTSLSGQNRPRNSFDYTYGDFVPAASPAEKTLAFGATIHFVRSSKDDQFYSTCHTVQNAFLFTSQNDVLCYGFVWFAYGDYAGFAKLGDGVENCMKQNFMCFLLRNVAIF